jgi:membrane-bound metal-dependent hydrolase YbcI (DUF457 family)
MFLGHFAVGFGAKQFAPRASLGTLFLAAQFIDLLWPTLVLLGVERVRIAPGITAVVPLDFEHYPISHSLFAVVGWALLFGAVYFLIRRDRRTSLVLGFAVLSHWLLDWLSHRPDLPLFPGSARVGLGLWQSLPATLIVELGLFVVGVALYRYATRAADRTGRWALGAVVARGPARRDLCRKPVRRPATGCHGHRLGRASAMVAHRLGLLAGPAPAGD